MKNIALMTVFFAVFMSVFTGREAFAQNENLDIVSEPICFILRNEADYQVLGDFTTAEFTRPDGIVTNHRSNFRLDKAGSKNPENGYPSDRAEFCSYGPFLADRQLRFRLRTLFPIFHCKTRVDLGQEIVIKGQRRADDSGVITWAECFNPDGSKTGKPEE